MKKIVSNGIGLAAGALTAYGGMKLAELACEKAGLFDGENAAGPVEACAGVVGAGMFCGIPIGLVSLTSYWSFKTTTEAAWDLAATLLKKLD